MGWRWVANGMPMGWRRVDEVLKMPGLKSWLQQWENFHTQTHTHTHHTSAHTPAHHMRKHTTHTHKQTTHTLAHAHTHTHQTWAHTNAHHTHTCTPQTHIHRHTRTHHTCAHTHANHKHIHNGVNIVDHWNIHSVIFGKTSISITLSTEKVLWTFPFKPERKNLLRRKSFWTPIFLFKVYVYFSISAVLL